jgi:hypothetical protein
MSYTVIIDKELETPVSDDALRAALEIESDVLISDRAFKRGEKTPGGELFAVDYTVYSNESEEGDGERPRIITLWVGLDPDIGAVNVDAGRALLESDGWQVTDWGAA